MKTKLTSMTFLLVILLSGCKKEETVKKGNIDTSSISFTVCNADTKSTDTNTPSIRLIGQADGKLIIKMINTEFCCGTDSISMDESINNNKINIKIIDNGPLTYCFCPHDLEFSLTSLDSKDYELTLIESENAYSRDTFLIQFKFSEQLDTTVTELISGNLIGNYPLDYVKAALGGCNGIFKSSIIDNKEEIDTLIFKERSDTMEVFDGLNLTCCIDFWLRI
jgi:hypothetical protein